MRAKRADNARALDHVAGEVVEWVRQPDAATGWHVATLRLPNGELLQVTGTHHPRVGCTLRAEGYFDDHPRYGRRFVVHRAEQALPESADGFVRWLSDMRVGVGDVRARALVDAFDTLADLYHAILHEPASLCRVQGITESIAQKLSEAVREQGAEAKYRIKLRGYGLTQNQIKRCLDVWETLDKTCAAIDSDPFQLAFHVDGFAFARADAVRLAMQIPHEHPSRLDAGTLFALSEHADDGNTYGGGKFVACAARDMLTVHASFVTDAVRRLHETKRVMMHNRRAYLSSLFTAEVFASRPARERDELEDQHEVYGSDGRDDYGQRDPDREWTADDYKHDDDFKV